MKPTIKSINAALPRLDTLRKNWMFPGQTGYATPRGYLRSAIVDVVGNEVESITLYAQGDAMYSRHYYAEDDGETTFVITPILWEVLSDEPAADPHKYRRHVCHMIQDAIANYKTDLAD